MVRLDHPRSRGVYAHILVRHLTHSGSSPLARGLLGSDSMAEYKSRIIPARAGFTNLGFDGVFIMEDHPRSRGVYARLPFVVSGMRGSSPLARGLLSRRVRECFRIRIIPARAGFTLRGPESQSEAMDHPRSRGVYLSRIRFGPP